MKLIDREHIRSVLLLDARNRDDVDPAMQLIEPVFVAIEASFPLEQRGVFFDNDIRNAIRAVSGDAKIELRCIKLSGGSEQNEAELSDNNRGENFGDVLQQALINIFPRTGMSVKGLVAFDDQLPLLLHHACKNGIAKELDWTYLGPASIIPSKASAEAQRAARGIITFYLNLVRLGDGNLITRYAKPALLLLPRAIPLARVKHKDGHWTVLVP